MRALIFLAIGASLAGPTPFPANAEGSAEECLGFDQTVGMFIKHRQHGGWSLQTMMEKVGHVPGLREIILDAYSVPRMPTPDTRRMAVEEFQNRWMIRCYRDGRPDMSEDQG